MEVTYLSLVISKCMGKRLGDFGKDHGDLRLYWQRTPCLGLNLRVPLPSSCAEFHILRGTRRRTSAEACRSA